MHKSINYLCFDSCWWNNILELCWLFANSKKKRFALFVDFLYKLWNMFYGQSICSKGLRYLRNGVAIFVHHQTMKMWIIVGLVPNTIWAVTGPSKAWFQGSAYRWILCLWSPFTAYCASAKIVRKLYKRTSENSMLIRKKFAWREREIPCFRKCAFFGYGKQSHEMGPMGDSSYHETCIINVWT